MTNTELLNIICVAFGFDETESEDIVAEIAWIKDIAYSSGLPLVHDADGNATFTLPSIAAAKAFYLLENALESVDPDTEVSVGVSSDESNGGYRIGEQGQFLNCRWGDVDSVDEWIGDDVEMH